MPSFAFGAAHAQDRRSQDGVVVPADYAQLSIPDPPSAGPSIIVAEPQRQYVAGPRSGFAFQLGFGMLGYANGSDTRTHASRGASLNLAFGAYLTPQSVFLIRFGIFGQTDDSSTNSIGAYTVQLQGQHWLDERWMFGAGFGMASVLFQHIPASHSRVGLGLSVRIGYAFSHWTHHSLLLVYEANAAVTSDVFANCHTLIIEWQVH